MLGRRTAVETVVLIFMAKDFFLLEKVTLMLVGFRVPIPIVKQRLRLCTADCAQILSLHGPQGGQKPWFDAVHLQ